MLTSFWQQLTLSPLPLTSGAGEPPPSPAGPAAAVAAGKLAAALGRLDWAGPGGLYIALAPYVSTTLIGVLLLAAAAFWVLLTLTDEAGVGMTPVHVTVAVFWGVMVLATALSPVRGAAVSGLIKLTLNILLFLLIARVSRQPRARTLLILGLSVHHAARGHLRPAAVLFWGHRPSHLGRCHLPLANTTRVYSFLGNPNLLAGYLIPAVMFSVMAVFAGRAGCRRGWRPSRR
jgi:putative inorganic carbon (hco3(-)) transporter